MTKFSDELMMKWKEDDVKQELHWHRDINKVEEKRLVDFEAGFRRGWEHAIATLKLHEMLNR